MKKIIYLIVTLLIFSGCQVEKKDANLSGKYLSITSSIAMNETTMLFENQMYDFDTDTYSDQNELERTSQYPLSVYDYKTNSLLYSNGDKNSDDQLFMYDIESKETKQLTFNLYAINYIIPRTNDIILVVVHDEHRMELWSMDRETYQCKELILPNKNNDMSVWNIAYVPETEDIMVQACSDMEEREAFDKQDLVNKGDPKVVYHYYKCSAQNKIDYLFEFLMPQSHHMVSNGKVIYHTYEDRAFKDNRLYKYDIESGINERVNDIHQFDTAFYLDPDGKKLYYANSSLEVFDIDTGKTTSLKNMYKYSGYRNNILLLKK